MLVSAAMFTVIVWPAKEEGVEHSLVRVSSRGQPALAAQRESKAANPPVWLGVGRQKVVVQERICTARQGLIAAGEARVWGSRACASRRAMSGARWVG